MALLSVLLNQWQPFQDVSKIYNSLSLFFFLLLLLLLLLILLFTGGQFLKLTGRSNNNNISIPPPSPPKLPIIGNLHQLLGNLTHRSLKALADRYGPLMYVYFGSSPTLVVSSAELASDVMKTHDIIFSNRPKTTAANILLYDCQDIVFSNYGEYWRQVRKICVLELLTTRRVQSFQRVREEEVSSLICKIRSSCFNGGGGSLVDLTEMLLVVSNNIVSRCILGRKIEEENDGKSKFSELSRTLEEQLTAFCVGDMFPSLGWLDVLSGLIGRLNATARALDALLDQVIEDHRTTGSQSDDDAEDSKDFVEILLQLQKDGMLGADLTQDNLKAILLDMFLGGTDTTGTVLEWVMAELVKNPTCMKRAQEEVRRVVKVKSNNNIDSKDIDKMEYLKCVVKETLRLHPPAPLLVPRETEERVRLGGYDIPAKTRVFVNAWAIQRDPQVWDKPEEFLPERFANNNNNNNQVVDFKGQDFEFIPFGGGRRGCPGISFGLAAVEHAISNLLYWFDWKLADGEAEENLDMSEVDGLTVHKKSPLRLVPTTYFP